jgi:UDP-N-acetylglucosamine 4,6-dehydratase/5-epimerase
MFFFDNFYKERYFSIILMRWKHLFENKTILITGGTGYLGKKITELLLEYNPHSIRLFSRDEVKHHRIQEYFSYNKKIRHLIGDVRDFERVKKASHGVDIVIHAAALKRLDILEYNVEESIKTNILGTLNVVNACLLNNVECALMISTDKACSPANTYGACKFVSERIFSESNYSRGSSRTRFINVRYGNVLESTGSVIPFFASKIKSGGPIPVTDERMTRFIISPEQAVNLIFDSALYGIGGEVFVPKLPAFKIMDLVKILKLKYNADTPVEIVGTRPGEKYHEYMINETEVSRTHSFKGLYVITSCIEKIKKDISPIYIKEGKLLNESEMTHYSSEDAVIDIDSLTRLFKELDLI